MGGPAASVLVRLNSPIPTWREILSPFACEWCDGHFCYIKDTRPFGGTYNGEPRPFVGSIDEFSGRPETLYSEYSEAEVTAVEATTERSFSHAIVLAATCNQSMDHRILGEVSAAIAERYDGIVNFDSLSAPLSELGLLKSEWIEDGLEYWIVLGSTASARKWLAHERFHMLK